MNLATVLAYIDPVSGMLFLQLAIGGCISCVIGFRGAILSLCRGGMNLLVKPKAELHDHDGALDSRDCIPFVRPGVQQGIARRKVA